MADVAPASSAGARVAPLPTAARVPVPSSCGFQTFYNDLEKIAALMRRNEKTPYDTVAKEYIHYLNLVAGDHAAAYDATTSKFLDSWSTGP